MEFRPCIDIHNGKVKQIVGSSLKDDGDYADENFVSKNDAAYFAEFYKEQGLYGGHVIMLNPIGSDYYKSTKEQGLGALRAFPGGLMAGGGINIDNAKEFLDAGASHVIMTSYIFHDGDVDHDRLSLMSKTFGSKRIVLDLSCKKKNGNYYVVTDRWSVFTPSRVSLELLNELSVYCDEYLIHAADIEGKGEGVDEELIELLGSYDGIPITYAGGVSSYDDIETVRNVGGGKVNLCIGSSLDLFGGKLNFETVKTMMLQG